MTQACGAVPSVARVLVAFLVRVCLKQSLAIAKEHIDPSRSRPMQKIEDHFLAWRAVLPEIALMVSAASVVRVRAYRRFVSLDVISGEQFALIAASIRKFANRCRSPHAGGKMRVALCHRVHNAIPVSLILLICNASNPVHRLCLAHELGEASGDAAKKMTSIGCVRTSDHSTSCNLSVDRESPIQVTVFAKCATSVEDHYDDDIRDVSENAEGMGRPK